MYKKIFWNTYKTFAKMCFLKRCQTVWIPAQFELWRCWRQLYSLMFYLKWQKYLQSRAAINRPEWNSQHNMIIGARLVAHWAVFSAWHIWILQETSDLDATLHMMLKLMKNYFKFETDSYSNNRDTVLLHRNFNQ